MKNVSDNKVSVDEMRKNAVETHYMSFGNLNPEKKFYIIWRDHGGAGFFSNMFHVIGHILYAEKMDMIPVVDMEHFPTFYNDENVTETKNAWEYHFSQLCPYPLEEVYQSKHVYFADGKFNYDVYFNESIENLHSIINKYIVLNKETLDEINRYKELFIDKKVLAVHLRGQDMKYTGGEHATPPSLSQVVDSINIMLEKHPIDKIFLATDEQGYLDELVKIYGDKICYVQAERAFFIPPKQKHSNMFHLQTLEVDKYQLSLDVILDAYLLASADYLIASGHEGKASGSNVSRYSQCLKGKFKDEIFIYNGLNDDLKPSPEEDLEIDFGEGLENISNEDLKNYSDKDLENIPSETTERDSGDDLETGVRHAYGKLNKTKKNIINVFVAFIPIKKYRNICRKKLRKIFSYNT